MHKLGVEEEQILRHICNKHLVNPDYLRILIQLKKENSYKSSAKKNELKNEIEKHMKIWAKNEMGDKQ